MLADVVDLLRCPRCRQPVSVTDRVLACTGPHRFDLARQGHVNLLTGPAPANADSAEMVAARERYLATGGHDSLRSLLVDRSHPTVLDAGCGPGWYLSGLPASTRAIGLDLSVAAVRRAARQHPRVGALVADSWGELPIIDRAIDTVWCVFAPRHFAEYARVLRPTGELILVLPGPDHLAELVSGGMVIGIEPGKRERAIAAAEPHFSVRWSESLRQQRILSPEALADLIAMGPSAHHRDRTDRSPVGTTDGVGVTVSFQIIGLARRS